jgi:hypothetical protein
MRNTLIAISALALAGFSQTSQADLLFTLNPAGLTGNAGGSVTFNATLTNTGTAPLFLNGDDSAIFASGLIIDDTPYFNNFPWELDPTESYTAAIFTVSIDPSVAPGKYTGSFTVVGGPDDGTFDNLASQNFQVTVAAVPEPFTLALCGGGLLLAWRHRRRT